MKTALVHYWLTAKRGGEKVLAELLSLHPGADLFTHAYAPEKLSDMIPPESRVTETFIGNLPFARSSCQKYLPLMPMALRHLKLEKYDLIISSESGPAKGIRKRKGAIHICYCHTPMRYLWDLYDDYYKKSGILGKTAMRLFRDSLRKYDLASAEGVDAFIANSHFVKERIRRIYGRESIVIHPPVDTAFYTLPPTPVEKKYYLLAGQLVSYKNPDLAISAFSRTNYPLVVAGEGPMEAELRKNAPKNILFKGRVSDEELRELYRGAKALVFPGIEDFGITIVESLACGTPVIALGAGGAMESLEKDKNGLFFNEEGESALLEAVEAMEVRNFSPEECRKRALEFSREKFREKFRQAEKEILGKGGKE